MAWLPNPGHLPDECIVFDAEGNVTRHRNVRVRYFNGLGTPDDLPGGWPSFGKAAVTWAIRPGEPHDFDIQFFEVVQ